MEADGLVVSAPIISRTVPGRLKLLSTGCSARTPTAPSSRSCIAVRERRRGAAVPVPARRAGAQAAGRRLHRGRRLADAAVEDAHAAGHAHPDVLDADRGGRPVRRSPAPARRSRSCSTTTRWRGRRSSARNVAGQLGRTFEEAEYVGEPGPVPALPPRRGRAARPRRRSARPAVRRAGSTDDFTVEWTDLDTSVISMAEKRAHYDEILETAAARTRRSRDDDRARRPRRTTGSTRPYRSGPTLPTEH